MKHELVSLNTKKTIAASLKKLMEKKPLSKITVSEIIEDCNVNRKTFYYHFVDIYDLLKWILEQEAIEVVRQFNLLVDYQDAIIFIVNYIKENKHILACAYDSLGRDELRRFLCADFMQITRDYIDRVEEANGLHVSSDYRDFLTILYTEALAGILIGAIKEDVIQDKQKVVQYVSVTLSTSVSALLKAADEREKT